MKNPSIKRLFISIALYSIVANFAHPVTPTKFIDLALPSYMFGIAFACMCFTNFLFSPFWGKLMDRIGTNKVTAISFFGYAVSQLIFGYATKQPTIIFARLLAGIFTGAISVSQLMYVVKNSEKNKLASNLAISATIHTTCSPIGYLIGGFIGDHSISLSFIVQVIGLILISFYYLFFVYDQKIDNTNINIKELLVNSNPFKVLYQSKSIINKTILLFLLIVFFAYVAITAQDQAFNYSLNDIYLLDPSYNGTVKAMVAIMSFIINTTIGLYILKKTNLNKSLSLILILQVLIVTVLLFINKLELFVIVNLMLYGLVAIINPLVQAVLSSIKTESSGTLIGVFNSFKSFGMVVGSSLAGYIYGFYEFGPFVLTIVTFFVAFILSVIFYVSRKKYQI